MATLEVSTKSSGRQFFELTADETVVGRDQFCDIVLRTHTVSRQHARIVRSVDGYYIEDLSSLNGTYLNGRRLEGRTLIKDQDRIHIYEVVTVFHAGSPAVAADTQPEGEPTSLDAGFYISAGGVLSAFPAAAPAHDVWDVTFKWVSNAAPRLRLWGSLYVAQKQTTGLDARLVTAYGGDVKLRYDHLWFSTTLKLNDWGPYDYHRDFNLTFPVQWYVDAAYLLAIPRLTGFMTRIGIRGQVRTLNQYTIENYVTDPNNTNATGLEYEGGAYIMVTL